MKVSVQKVSPSHYPKHLTSTSLATCQPPNNRRTLSVVECILSIIFSHLAENYAQNTLLRRQCPTVISHTGLGGRQVGAMLLVSLAGKLTVLVSNVGRDEEPCNECGYAPRTLNSPLLTYLLFRALHVWSIENCIQGWHAFLKLLLIRRFQEVFRKTLGVLGSFL